jgi:hypothetical protein
MSTNTESIVNFLKKYTSIPNKFIDNYYHFHQLCEKNPFGIHIKLFMAYLDIKNEKEIRMRLRSMFTQDTDYTVTQEIVKGQKNYFRNAYSHSKN